MKISKIALLMLLAISLQANAQLKKGDVLDKIVAIVGEQMITESEVKGRIVFMMQQDKSIRFDDPVLFKQVLDGIIDEKLMIEKAKLDSIVVSDEEIEERWNIFLQQSVMQLGSEQRVEQVYGMSIPKMKNDFKEEIKNKILNQKIVEKEFAQVEISQAELEEFYKKYQDSLPIMPESFSLYRIVKEAKAKSQDKEDIYKMALRIRDSIIQSGNFDDFAKTHSQDIATKDDGGNLGWIAKGKFLPELEKAGFALLPGEISLPIETPLGFHILKLVDKRNNEINVSHILFKIGQSDDDKEWAKSFLDSLRKNIKSLEEFKEVAKQVSDDEETRGFGGSMGNVTMDGLTAQAKEAIEKIELNQITEPVIFNSDVNHFSYQIIYKEKVVPAHKMNLQQDYQIIQQQALQYKKMDLYNKWIAKLRKELYWEIIQN